MSDNSMVFKPEAHDDLIKQWYRKDGYEYQLMGIMLDDEDYWWVMSRGGKCNKHTQMLSCVCSIETYGFKKID